MAFVFRSEKKSIFDDQKFNNQSQTQPTLPALPQNENKPQQKQVDLTKIVKGLPSSNQKFRKKEDSQSQQKGLPQFDVKPIHKSQSFVTLRQILYLSKTQSELEKEQKQNFKSLKRMILAEKSNKPHKSSLMLSFSKKTMKINEFQQKPLQDEKKVQKEKPRIQCTRSQSNIVNKNLLKTLTMLRSKQNIPQSFKQINMISEKHCKTPSDSLSSKRFNFQSMKKLSPIKSLIKQNLKQNVQANAINLFLNKKILSKIESKDETNQSKHESKKIFKQILQKQETNEDSEEEQFDQGATPGPGAYNFENWNKKKQFRSKRQKFGKIFYSSLQRFENTSKLNQVTLVNEQKPIQIEESPNKNAFTSFLSKSPRFDKQKSIQVPPPGYYNTRQTLQYDLIKNILKGSNSDTFISTEPRRSIVTKKIDTLPGPGSYYVDTVIDKLAQEHGIATSSYKSNLPRNLHQSPKETIKKQSTNDSIIETEGDGKFNPIHVQDPSTLPADYEIQSPPFLSSSERFPALKPICKEPFYKKKAQIPNKKEVNKQGFNSSQKRNLQNKVGAGVGVGLYNISAKQAWNKKSHNILFN